MEKKRDISLSMHLNVSSNCVINNEIFCCYLLTGLAYRNASQGFTIMACFSLFSASSFLFVAPAVSEVVLQRCRKIFIWEQADGVCHSYQLILHTFIHVMAVTFLPIVLGTLILFSMVIDFDWSFSMFSLVALINLAVNGASVAMVRSVL